MTTREKAIEIMREAGCQILTIPGVGQVARYHDNSVTNLAIRLIDLAKKQENEACAVAVEQVGAIVTTDWAGEEKKRMPRRSEYVAAIRARMKS